MDRKGERSRNRRIARAAVAAIRKAEQMKDARIEDLEPALERLVAEVEECLDNLDPCPQAADTSIDCCEYHHLTLDVLPAAREALKGRS